MIFQTIPAIINIRQAAVRYTARQPAISAIAPEINRDNRMPETMPLVRVPTAASFLRRRQYCHPCHQHLHHHGHQADDQHGAKQRCYIGDNPAATNAATESNS